MGKLNGPYWYIVDSPSLKDALYQVYLKLAQWFFNVLSLCFCYCVIMEKKYCPSIEETWVPFTQGCIVPSWIEATPVVLKKIFCCVNLLSQFHYYLPFEKDVWTIFHPLHQICFVPSLAEIWPVLKRIFFWNCQLIFAKLLISLIWKRFSPLLEQNRVPFNKGSFVPSIA